MVRVKALELVPGGPDTVIVSVRVVFGMKCEMLASRRNVPPGCTEDGAALTEQLSPTTPMLLPTPFAKI